MAHNRQPDLKHNYSSSSDDEEEEEEASGSEDEQTSASESDQASDSESQDNQKQETKKPLIVPPQSANKLQRPDPSSSDTEESGSETDSDSQPRKPLTANLNIKPISSKPMEREDGPNLESKSAKKSGSKASSTSPPAKTKRPPPAPTAASEKDVKKAKKGMATDEDSKKQLFQRLWSEDDEIVILKGIIDYKTENSGKDPVTDMGAFHEFIKKSLHVDVSRAQLVDKVRRLRKKYENNASREKNGKDRSFTKSHEQKGYDLSKLIWGGSGNSYNSVTESKKSQNQKNGNAKGNPASTSNVTAVALLKSNGVDEKETSTMEVEKNMDISRFVQYGRSNDSPILPDEIVKAGMELVEGSKREELEGKWKKLKIQELQLFSQRMELLKEQTAVILEAVNASGN